MDRAIDRAQTNGCEASGHTFCVVREGPEIWWGAGFTKPYDLTLAGMKTHISVCVQAVCFNSMVKLPQSRTGAAIMNNLGWC